MTNIYYFTGNEETNPNGYIFYNETSTKGDIKHFFTRIQQEIVFAKSRSELTALYRRAGYVMKLIHSAAWEGRYGRMLPLLRKIGRDEFDKTVRKLNRQAQLIGTEANYDENWNY